MRTVICAAILLFVFTYVSCDTIDNWTRSKQRYNRKYDEKEEAARRRIFERNERLINEHNSGNHSYQLALNEYADMTQQEIEHHLGLRPIGNDFSSLGDSAVMYAGPILPLPDSVDWRESNYVTDVRSPIDCGSRAVFSVIASLEGQHAKWKKTGLIRMSEQQIADCAGKGCIGPVLWSDTYKYLIKAGGIMSQEDYPNRREAGDCRFNNSKIVDKVVGIGYMPRGNEYVLQGGVAHVGPIAAGIDATHYTFIFYRSGIYYNDMCSKKVLSHGVTITGYGTEGGKNYWTIKNSWGTAWGESGYARIYRGLNVCGIANSANYPFIA